MEITECPTCGTPMEVQVWWPGSGTSGTRDTVEMVKTFCVRRHWFLMPRELLAGGTSAPGRAGLGAESLQ